MANASDTAMKRSQAGTKVDLLTCLSMPGDMAQRRTGINGLSERITLQSPHCHGPFMPGSQHSASTQVGNPRWL